MLINAVVLPESFLAKHFCDPTYHLNLQELLCGIHANGLILVDAEGVLYHQMCNSVATLASLGKGKRAHALFEELLKKQRQKVIRFVKTECSFDQDQQTAEIASYIAVQCEADSIIVDPIHEAQITGSVSSSVQVIPVAEYIGSKVEVERRHFFETLPSLDRMAPGQFDRAIAGATRFSRWIRFYDKQIGKGTSIGRFRRGMERILTLWTESAHYPREQLSAEVYTVVDESPHKQYQPSVAYHRVKGDLIEELKKQFGIPIKLSYKRDRDSSPITHPRHLQTQSLAILFERGFDFVEDDGALCRSFIKPDAACMTHLQEYRHLDEYVPGESPSLLAT